MNRYEDYWVTFGKLSKTRDNVDKTSTAFRRRPFKGFPRVSFKGSVNRRYRSCCHCSGERYVTWYQRIRSGPTVSPRSVDRHSHHCHQALPTTSDNLDKGNKASLWTASPVERSECCLPPHNCANEMKSLYCYMTCRYAAHKYWIDVKPVRSFKEINNRQLRRSLFSFFLPVRLSREDSYLHASPAVCVPDRVDISYGVSLSYGMRFAWVSTGCGRVSDVMRHR